MLKDRLFYPLAALLIAAMVALALSFGSSASMEDDELIAAGWRMEGPGLRNLAVSPGTNLRYVDVEGGYVRMSAFTPFDVGPGSLGVFAALGPDYERVFAGRPLRIRLRARAADSDPLEAFDVAYFPVEAAPSDWQIFELGRDWQDYSFDYTPPIVAAKPNTDLLSIFPGKAGEQAEMDLASVRIEVLQP